MRKKLENKDSTTAEPAKEENAEDSSPTQVQEGGANANLRSKGADVASLAKVLEEIRDFRKDTKEQLSDIKSELTNVNQNIEDAEVRI